MIISLVGRDSRSIETIDDNLPGLRYPTLNPSLLGLFNRDLQSLPFARTFRLTRAAADGATRRVVSRRHRLALSTPDLGSVIGDRQTGVALVRASLPGQGLMEQECDEQW